MTREKKIFAPVLRHYGEDLSKRWRVEYLEPGHNAHSAKRVVLYGCINTVSTVEARHQKAAELISNLSFVPKAAEKNILEKVIETGALYWRPKTKSAYTTVSDRFALFLGKKRTPELATTQTIQEFLLSLSTAGTNQNTIAKYRNTLYTLYQKAVEDGSAMFNPVKKVAGIRRSPTSLHYFSDKQIELFKKVGLHPQLWLGIQLLFFCFIRPGEQRLLRIADINLEYGFIEIPGAISKNRKTEKVAIPDAFAPYLQHLRNYPNNFYVLSKSGCPGITPISTKWLNYEHAKVLDLLRIRGHYAFYSWKHTGAVKAVRAGVNLKDLQLQLRHHSLDMVNEYLKNLGVLDSADLRQKFPIL
jgi:integrase